MHFTGMLPVVLALISLALVNPVYSRAVPNNADSHAKSTLLLDASISTRESAAPISELQLRGNKVSNWFKKPAAANTKGTAHQEAQGHGDCSIPTAAHREPTTGANCAAMGGRGFKKGSGVGGCLSKDEMMGVHETGVCWISAPAAAPHHGFARPPKPVGPRPVQPTPIRPLPPIPA